MKVIVLSAQKPIQNELEILISLFEEGMNTFHLRKPHYTIKKMRSYLDKIPKEYHNRIVIHSHHKLAVKYNLKGINISSKDRKKAIRTWIKIKSLKRKNPWLSISTSFNSINELDKYNDIFDYVLLSPVFDSITSKDYQSGFKEFTLTSSIQRSNYNIVALGGLDENKIEKAFNIGFWGCAFLGSIWTSDDPVQTLRSFKTKCRTFKKKIL